jgi:hypothetical protein
MQIYGGQELVWGCDAERRGCIPTQSVGTIDAERRGCKFMGVKNLTCVGMRRGASGLHSHAERGNDRSRLTVA